MSAILAKKLGMTQLFQEDGSVARVTVLQAGPCPVTAIRTPDRDGYEAVQLAFGQAKEKHRFTVIRSPHKDKDSREHFEMRVHKRLLDILEPSPKTVDSLQRLELPAGVDIEIKIQQV